MPTYVYETIPEDASEEPERFEVKQSMSDDKLTHHPDTGVPVRRLVSGGFGYAAKSSAGGSAGGG